MVHNSRFLVDKVTLAVLLVEENGADIAGHGHTGAGSPDVSHADGESNDEPEHVLSTEVATVEASEQRDPKVDD